MTTPQISRNNEGWLITKGSNKTQITDSNRNGVLDDGDVAKALSGKLISQSELQSAMDTYNSQTPQQKQQPQSAPPKKSQNIFGKIGGFFSGMASGLFGIFGGGFGGGDAWSRNINGGVGFNDMQVGLFANKPGFLNADLNSMMGSMGMNPMMMGMGGSAMGGMNFGEGFAQLDQALVANQQAYENIMADAKQNNIDEVYSQTETQLNNFKEKPESIDESNLKKYEDALNAAKSNNKEFNEDNMKLITKIITAPLVKEELIQDASNEENKIPATTAAKISALLTKYNAETDTEKKEKILTTENHDNLQAILAKTSLDAEDIKAINEIVK